jgi:hypothetical protein
MADVHGCLREALADILGDDADKVKSGAVDRRAEVGVSIDLGYSWQGSRTEAPGRWGPGRGVAVGSAQAAEQALGADAARVHAAAVGDMAVDPAPWQKAFQVSRTVALPREFGVEETCGDCCGCGEVRCPTCRGSRREACPSCRGDKSNKCASCDGEGSAFQKHYAKPERLRCLPCSGTGRISCTVCGASGQTPCGRCQASGRVGCGRCNTSGAVTLTYSGAIELTSSGKIWLEEQFDPLRTRAFEDYGEVAFRRGTLSTPAEIRTNGCDFEGSVGYSVAQVAASGESAVLVFVAGEPSAAVASGPLAKAFEPFFDLAGRTLSKGLPAFVQWGRQRPFAAQLFRDAVKTDHPDALRMAAARQAPFAPKSYAAKLIRLLTPPALSDPFRKALAQGVDERADHVKRLEARQLRRGTLAALATVAGCLAGAALVLNRAGATWSFGLQTADGKAILSTLGGVVILSILELVLLGIANHDLHVRESAALDGAADVNALERRHRTKAFAGRAAALMLGGGVCLGAPALLATFRSQAISPAPGAEAPKAVTQPVAVVPVVASVPAASAPAPAPAFDPPGVMPGVPGYALIGKVDDPAGAAFEISCLPPGANQPRRVTVRRTPPGDDGQPRWTAALETPAETPAAPTPTFEASVRAACLAPATVQMASQQGADPQPAAALRGPEPDAPPTDTAAAQARSTTAGDESQQMVSQIRGCLQTQDLDCAEANLRALLRIQPERRDALDLLRKIGVERQAAFASNWNAR